MKECVWRGGGRLAACHSKVYKQARWVKRRVANIYSKRSTPFTPTPPPPISRVRPLTDRVGQGRLKQKQHSQL